MVSVEAGEASSLREQLAEKELRVYELELRVKELQELAEEGNAAKDKLALANRNARLLEEENSNLQATLRQLRGEPSTSGVTTPRSDLEARQLINENAQLRNALEEAKETAESASAAHVAEVATLQQTLYAAQEEVGRVTREKTVLQKERDALRSRCNELEQALANERDTSATNANLWKQERVVLEAKLRDVQGGAGGSVQSLAERRRRMSASAVSGIDAVEQNLLKEEVAQLEERLREAREEYAAREREWTQRVEALKAEAAQAQASVRDSGNKSQPVALLQALRDQITSLQKEVAYLQGQQAQQVVAIAEKDATIAALEAEQRAALAEDARDTPAMVRKLAMVAGRQSGEGGKAGRVTSVEDNVTLLQTQDELQACRLRLGELQTALEAKEVRCEELVARIAELERQRAGVVPGRSKSPLHRQATSAPSVASSVTAAVAVGSSSEVASHDGVAQQQQQERLQMQLREARRQLSDALAVSEQRGAIAEAKAKEAAKQIDALIKENGGLRARSEAVAARLHDAEQHINAQSLHDEPRRSNLNAAQSANDAVAVNGFSVLCKDKRDSVDDVMRMLEAAWDEGAEARAALHGTQDAALTLHDAAREDELDRLRHALAEAEGRLQDLAFDADAADKLRRDLRAREDEVMDLQKALRDMERLLDAQHADQDRMQGKLRALEADGDSLAKENDKLRRRVAESQRQRDGLDSAYNDRLNDLNRQLKDIKENSARMQRQMKAARASPHRPTPPPQRLNTQNLPSMSSARQRTPVQRTLSQLSLRSSEEQRRSAVPVGAHLTVTVVELANVMHNGQPLTEPGYIVMKVKSIKEKYKTSIKDLAPVVRFDETFVFYLAQPNQDVITLHVFYKSKNSSREFHVGDACFSMATLYRGVPRQRIAPVVQNPGTKDALRSAQVEVILQTDDFGRTTTPTAAELEDERLRFDQLASKFEAGAPEKLHAVDVYLTSEEI